MKNNKAKERQNKDDSATEIHTKIINDSNVPIIESNAYINQGEEKNRQKHHNQSEQIVEPEKKRSKLKLEDADRGLSIKNTCILHKMQCSSMFR